MCLTKQMNVRFKVRVCLGFEFWGFEVLEFESSIWVKTLVDL